MELYIINSKNVSIDVAIVSESNKGDNKEYYVEIHKLEYNEKLEQDYIHLLNLMNLDYKGE